MFAVICFVVLCLYLCVGLFCLFGYSGYCVGLLCFQCVAALNCVVYFALFFGLFVCFMV